MKAQKEFEKIETYEALIKSKEEELIRLDAMAKKITAELGGETVSRSRNLDPLGTVLAKKDAVQKEVDRLKKALENHKAFLRAIIERLEKAIYIRVLYGHYINEKDLKDIAKEEGYTYRNICYIRNDALAALDKILQTI